MKIDGEHALASPRDRVWRALQDPDVLARTVPGCSRLEARGQDVYAIVVTAGVGSVKGRYDGTFELRDKRDGESCAVRVTAAGTAGSVSAEARMHLADGPDGGTRLVYDADATVTGPLAGVGQRLLAGAVRRTTVQFLTALDRELLEPVGEAGAPVTAVPDRRRERDLLAVAVSVLAGAAAALAGVGVGRWWARR